MNDKLKNAYFAGLIDGEGSFDFFSKGKNKRALELSVKMTCKKTIQALADHFSCGRPVKYRPPQKSGWKPQYEWRIRNQRARNILIAIRPYLITKRKQVDLILSMPPRKRGRPKKGEGRTLPPLITL